jgi:hypothetical protein
MASTTVVDILTMDEIEQLNLLTGKSFEEMFKNGLGLGKATKSLCWVLDKRNNPDSSIEKFGSMNIHEINAFLEGFIADPKGQTT